MVREAAQLAGINFHTAKAIYNVFQTENRVHKKTAGFDIKQFKKPPKQKLVKPQTAATKKMTRAAMAISG